MGVSKSTYELTVVYVDWLHGKLKARMFSFKILLVQNCRYFCMLNGTIDINVTDLKNKRFSPHLIDFQFDLLIRQKVFCSIGSHVESE